MTPSFVDDVGCVAGCDRSAPRRGRTAVRHMSPSQWLASTGLTRDLVRALAVLSRVEVGRAHVCRDTISACPDAVVDVRESRLGARERFSSGSADRPSSCACRATRPAMASDGLSLSCLEKSAFY